LGHFRLLRAEYLVHAVDELVEIISAVEQTRRASIGVAVTGVVVIKIVIAAIAFVTHESVEIDLIQNHS
jgi:hypothetical protein